MGLQVFLFPVLVRRYNYVVTFRISVVFSALLVFFLPFIAGLQPHPSVGSPRHTSTPPSPPSHAADTLTTTMMPSSLAATAPPSVAITGGYAASMPPVTNSTTPLVTSPNATQPSLNSSSPFFPTTPSIAATTTHPLSRPQCDSGPCRPSRAAFAMLLVAYITWAGGQILAFSAIMVLINNSCRAQYRGIVNGLGQSLANLARMTAPTLGGVVFAWSEQNGLRWPLDFHFVFHLLGVLHVFLLLLSLLLPPAINEKMPERSQAAAAPASSARFEAII